MAKKTYADIAQQIINKYSKRGDADIWANQAKEMQLKQLMNKQEAERERMGLVDKSVMANGGKMKYDGYGVSSFLPEGEEINIPTDQGIYDVNVGTIPGTYPVYTNPNQVIPTKVAPADDYTNRDFDIKASEILAGNNIGSATISKDGQNSKFNYLDVLSLAPVAYNAIQGMLPEQKLKASDYQVTDRIKPYKLNYDPAKQEALSSNRALNREIMNTGNKSVGDVIRNLRGSRLDYNKQVSDITSKEQMGNAAIDMQAQQANIGIDQSNKSIKFSVDDWNAKSKAARINMLGEAATQLSQFAQGKKTDKVTINAINSMLSNYMFDMNGNLVYKNTGKLVPQDEANQVKQVMVNK